MAEASSHKSPFADVAPALADITDNVLFGDVWKRPGLSPRDRSLVTIVSLISLYRTNELPFHLKRAMGNGVTREEIAENINTWHFTQAGRRLARRSASPARSSKRRIVRKVPTNAEAHIRSGSRSLRNRLWLHGSELRIWHVSGKG